MYLCPVCHVSLDRARSEEGLVWSCRECGGHAATISILRKSVDRDFVSELWRKLRSDESRICEDRACPACRKPMVSITEEAITGPLELDVCRSCQFFWLDFGEKESLPKKSSESPPPELSPEAKKAFALVEIEMIAKRYEEPSFGASPPEEWWQILATIVGLPAEEDARGVLGKPWLTWGIAIALLVVSLFTFRNFESAIASFGLIPAEFLRSGGATLLTSFFLHGGFFHFLGNVYFLLVFGDNVEDTIGHGRFLLLITLATLFGGLCHVYADPYSTTPVIGASGGVSGIIAFYALAFPKVRINVFLHFWWVAMPAIFAFIAWMIFQAAGAWFQLEGFGNVSYLAHLGGVLVGFLFWLGLRKRL
ncbi:MAG: rhomboid family intramembrane serine protease [Verrucomicrobiota bacterium]